MAYVALPLLAVAALTVALLAVAAWQYLGRYVLRRWRRRVELPDPCGYCLGDTVVQGQALELYLHSTEPLRIEFRLWSAHGVETVQTVTHGPARQSAQYDHWRGFDWKPTLQIPTDDLPPGLYMVVLRHHQNDAQVWRCPLIVRPMRPARVAVIASTNTWQAYNHFGNLSNYHDKATPWPLRWILSAMRLGNLSWVIGDRHFLPIVPLPLRRPNSAINADLAALEDPRPSISHLVRSEAALIQTLEQAGVAYSIYSDDDFAYAGDALQADVVIFNTHSEYWTQEAEARLEQYVRGGGRVAFLSGNNLYRLVQRLNDALAVICQKTDGESVAARLGCAYDARGYLTFAPYRVERPDHWLFEGLNLASGDLFGESRLGGASGYETDKPNRASGDFVVLATGAQSGGGAFMVYRDTPQGGWIFNCGSVAFTSALPDSPALRQIIANLVTRAMAESASTRRNFAIKAG